MRCGHITKFWPMGIVSEVKPLKREERAFSLTSIWMEYMGGYGKLEQPTCLEVETKYWKVQSWARRTPRPMRCWTIHPWMLEERKTDLFFFSAWDQTLSLAPGFSSCQPHCHWGPPLTTVCFSMPLNEPRAWNTRGQHATVEPPSPPPPQLNW